MEVDLHVTNRCNLKCKHCVYTSGEWEMPDMTLDTVKNLIPSFKKLGVKEVHITGGEPLVNREFFDIAKCLHENGFGTRVQTNGILITPEIISSFSFTLLGIDSPVIEEVSKDDFPLIMTPSIGTLSPDLTIIKSLILTS